MRELLIIIPAWNEEEALPTVLKEISDVTGLNADVVVVDDGSSDQTSAVARAAGATRPVRSVHGNAAQHLPASRRARLIVGA